MVFELLVADQPRARRRARPGLALLALGRRGSASTASRFPPRRARRQPDRQPSGDGGAARRLHPVQPVRARLPRGPGQRRDRHGRRAAIIEKIVFDFDDPMGSRTCVACGECVQACPTGALMPASLVDEARRAHADAPDREVDSVCPYCGVGCQLTYQIKDDQHRRRSTAATARRTRTGSASRAASASTTSHHPDRLTEPLIRKAGRAQARRRRSIPANPLDAFPRGDLGGGARRAPPAASTRIRDATAAARWPASARPRARTRRPTCSRSWCAPASAPTTSTTARGSATPPRSRR